MQGGVKTMDILQEVKKHYNTLCGRGYEVVFTALQGSQNYGLDEYTDEYYSDVDTKSIVLPSFEDFCAAKQPISAVEIIKDELGRETHAEVKDIRVMFSMFLKENISYIELLFSKYVVVNPKYQWVWDKLVEVKEWIAAYDIKQFVKCIAGMAYEKQKALCHPYPSIADKVVTYGYDGKQLSHAARLLIFITKFKEGESIEQCYEVPEVFKGTLINYKKQLDENGNLLSCEDAIEIMNRCVKKIDEIKNEIVNSSEFVGTSTQDKFLEEIKIKVLKQRFIELLNN